MSIEKVEKMENKKGNKKAPLYNRAKLLTIYYYLHRGIQGACLQYQGLGLGLGLGFGLGLGLGVGSGSGSGWGFDLYTM